jgi:hypothetical protein
LTPTVPTGARPDSSRVSIGKCWVTIVIPFANSAAVARTDGASS